jgi:RuvB-like protein 1
VIPGVLFIDEVHMLDVSCFSFLQACLESPLCPVVILATNRGLTHVRNNLSSANVVSPLSPHGIPMDFLDRLLIVPTRPYSREEVVSILQLRAQSEQVPLPLSWAVCDALSEVALRTSLRYAAQLLKPAALCAECAGRNQLTPEDIAEVDGLFLDGKASAKLLHERQETASMTQSLYGSAAGR